MYKGARAIDFLEFSHATFQLRELESKLWWWWTAGHGTEKVLTICSISSLVAFRDLSFNDLTELLPGIFDSLALLTLLCVFSFVADTSFVLSFLEPDTLSLFPRSPWLSKI